MNPMKPLYDPNLSYGSPDEEDTKEFAKFHPIWKGLTIASLIGIGISLLVFLGIYLKLEHVI